jgi:hypothetical protein
MFPDLTILPFSTEGLHSISIDIFVGSILIAALFASFLSMQSAVKNRENAKVFFFFFGLGIILAILSFNAALYLSVKHIGFAVFLIVLSILVFIVTSISDNTLLEEQIYNELSKLEETGCSELIRKIESLSLSNFIRKFSTLLISFILPAIGSMVLTNLIGIHRASSETFFSGISIFSTIFITASLFLCLADSDNEDEDDRIYLFFFIAGIALFILAITVAVFLFFKYVEFTIYFIPFFAIFTAAISDAIKKVKI